uniref:G-protein coupled receptors family 1 profile domain-containing protein n=1 Tax=Glossina palpalis gambiensis TaxID=67801 RepID=A0A1B0ATZ0_9MUSC
MEEDVVYVNEVDSIYNDSNIWELQTVTSSEEHQLENALMVWSQKQQQQQQPHPQQTQLKLSQYNNNTFLFYNNNNLNATANLNLWYTENQIDSTLLSPSSSQLSSVTTTLATLFYVNISNATITSPGKEELLTSSAVVDNTTNNHLNNYWALLALILVIGTAAGNILVCLAIAWERRLQNVTNYFLMSLAITDLMVAVLVMPLGILTLVKVLEIGIILRTQTMTSEQHHDRYCCHFAIIIVIIIMSTRKLPPIELKELKAIISTYQQCRFCMQVFRLKQSEKQEFRKNNFSVRFILHLECLRRMAVMTTLLHIVKLTLVYTVGGQHQQKQNEQFTQYSSYKFSFEMRKTLKLLHSNTKQTFRIVFIFKL